MTYRVIDIGCGEKSHILNYIQEYIPEWDEKEIEVTRLDVQESTKPDILHNILQPMPKELYEKFDLAYMSHVLEHIPWRDTVSVANEVAKLVKQGGYFLISVPSIEWACREVLRGNFNLVVMMTFYGGQDDEWLYHRCGFTKPTLEMLADKIGMKIYSLRDTNVVVLMNSSNGHAMQHVLLMRKESDGNPAEAIA